MPSPSNRPLREEPTDGSRTMDSASPATEPPAKRRRVFLQTMGHQLREVGVLRDSPSENAASFAGSPGSASHSRSVNDGPTAHAQAQAQVHIQTPESDVVPGEEDQLPTGATMSAAKDLWHPGAEVLAMPITDGSDVFTFDDLLAWTRSYFDHWHPSYPFLHAPSILELFEHIVHHGVTDATAASTQQRVILRSIMSISLADRRQTKTAMRPVPPQLVFTSINDAIHSIQCFLTDESSLLSLQAVISVQLLLLSMLRYNAASRLEGLAARMAFHLGLHRCPVQFSAFPAHDVELRQRIFWSIYCMDRYICIRLGVPLSIRDSDVNVCFSGSERHGGGDHGQADGSGRLDLLRFLARLAEIRGSIMELRNKFISYRQTDIDDAVVIDANLTKWWNEVDEHLESNCSNSFSISLYHQVTLIILRHESIIALNKHILATSKKSSAYDAALQNCIGAARSIISTLHKALVPKVDLDHPEAQEVPENPGLLWPSFTWAVWMSAFLMIYAANEDQVSQDVAIRLADRALEVLKHLALRGSMWPNACAAAIRDLRVQLISRRNRSKHTHVYDAHAPKGVHCEGIPRKVPEFITQQSTNSNGDFRLSPSTSARLQHPQSTRSEGPPFRSNHHMLYSSQIIGSTRNTVSVQNGSAPSFTYDMPPAGLSSVPQPFLSRQNCMSSELPPGFGDAEGNGYAYRVGAQLESELQIQNYEGSDFFYGLDAPFWADNDQWRGMG